MLHTGRLCDVHLEMLDSFAGNGTAFRVDQNKRDVGAIGFIGNLQSVLRRIRIRKTNPIVVSVLGRCDDKWAAAVVPPMIAGGLINGVIDVFYWCFLADRIGIMV